MEHSRRTGGVVRQAAVDRDGSVGIETGYGLDGTGIESRRVRFSTHFQTGSEAHSASHTMSTGSFPRVKWPVRAADLQPPSSSEVKERVQLHVYFPSGPHGTLQGVLHIGTEQAHELWQQHLPEVSSTYTVNCCEIFGTSKVVSSNVSVPCFGYIGTTYRAVTERICHIIPQNTLSTRHFTVQHILLQYITYSTVHPVPISLLDQWNRPVKRNGRAVVSCVC
jgi:hypothetical protein